MRWEQRIVAGLDLRTFSAGMKTLQSITSISNNHDELYFLEAILASKLISGWRFLKCKFGV